ncbi:hypothetical protein [Sphingomicrobium flavum]|uniref:hypothetical protein n=1 Tax=Sphingomicrobium flavum TaxID=1229164 RepID=UPI0021AD9B6B|nr:hypothetical protein [Sphingomicrobium flavum]
MKSIFTAVAAVAIAAAVPTVPAMAQDATSIAAGMEVVHDKSGAPVGSVSKLENGMIFISTDMHADVPMPVNAFLLHEGKVLFGMTKADLNAAVSQAKAEAAASVAIGKPVKGVSGNDVGVIEAMNDEAITIRMTNGKVVAVPVDAVQGQQTGAIALYEAAQLEGMGVDMTPEQVQEAEAARAAEKADEHAGHDMGDDAGAEGGML